MGRIIEIKNQFVISDLNVHGYTTEDNVYLHLNSKNVDLVEFKRSAIRYIGLSLSDKKMETYVSAYREISEKFGIKINGLEDEKNIVEATPSVEVSGNDDVVGSENEVELDSAVDGGSGDLDTTTNTAVVKEIKGVVLEIPVIEEKPVNKPKRSRRSAARTNGLTVGKNPKK